MVGRRSNEAFHLFPFYQVRGKKYTSFSQFPFLPFTAKEK